MEKLNDLIAELFIQGRVDALAQISSFVKEGARIKSDASLSPNKQNADLAANYNQFIDNLESLAGEGADDPIRKILDFKDNATGEKVFIKLEGASLANPNRGQVEEILKDASDLVLAARRAKREAELMLTTLEQGELEDARNRAAVADPDLINDLEENLRIDGQQGERLLTRKEGSKKLIRELNKSLARGSNGTLSYPGTAENEGEPISVDIRDENGEVVGDKQVVIGSGYHTQIYYSTVQDRNISGVMSFSDISEDLTRIKTNLLDNDHFVSAADRLGQLNRNISNDAALNAEYIQATQRALDIAKAYQAGIKKYSSATDNEDLSRNIQGNVGLLLENGDLKNAEVAFEGGDKYREENNQINVAGERGASAYVYYNLYLNTNNPGNPTQQDLSEAFDLGRGKIDEQFKGFVKDVGKLAETDTDVRAFIDSRNEDGALSVAKVIGDSDDIYDYPPAMLRKLQADYPDLAAEKMFIEYPYGVHQHTGSDVSSEKVDQDRSDGSPTIKDLPFNPADFLERTQARITKLENNLAILEERAKYYSGLSEQIETAEKILRDEHRSDASKYTQASKIIKNEIALAEAIDMPIERVRRANNPTEGNPTMLNKSELAESEKDATKQIDRLVSRSIGDNAMDQQRLENYQQAAGNLNDLEQSRTKIQNSLTFYSDPEVGLVDKDVQNTTGAYKDVRNARIARQVEIVPKKKILGFVDYLGGTAGAEIIYRSPIGGYKIERPNGDIEFTEPRGTGPNDKAGSPLPSIKPEVYAVIDSPFRSNLKFTVGGGLFFNNFAISTSESTAGIEGKIGILNSREKYPRPRDNYSKLELKYARSVVPFYGDEDYRIPYARQWGEMPVYNSFGAGGTVGTGAFRASGEFYTTMGNTQGKNPEVDIKTFNMGGSLHTHFMLYGGGLTVVAGASFAKEGTKLIDSGVTSSNGEPSTTSYKTKALSPNIGLRINF